MFCRLDTVKVIISTCSTGGGGRILLCCSDWL